MNEHIAVRRWLMACIVSVFFAVVIGGITRLTESGLSITEWKPVAGVVPPLNEADWQTEFAKYQATPEYQKVNHRMSLDEFKGIFWWEYFHRVLGRTIGLVFFLPFLAVGLVPGPEAVLALPGLLLLALMRLTWLPLLTLAQGVLGWYMVRSGLEVRTEVSAYRLAAHLALALTILVIALWTWADLDPKREEVPINLRRNSLREIAEVGEELRAVRRAARGVAGRRGAHRVPLLRQQGLLRD